MKNAVYYKVEVKNILHSVLYITCQRKYIAYVVDIAYVVAWKRIYWIRPNYTFVTSVLQSMNVFCKNVNLFENCTI